LIDRFHGAGTKEKMMGVTAFPATANYPQDHAEILKPESSNPDWMGLAVGGTFLASALLLLSGKKRAGLVTAAAATALTLLNEEETVREWWNALPRYLDDAQRLLNQAQDTIDDLVAKREKLRSMLDRRVASDQ
jgi:hypothetical protein